MIDLSLIADRRGLAEMKDGTERTVEVGDTVTYVCHEASRTVRVRFDDGAEGSMHPHCFERLR